MADNPRPGTYFQKVCTLHKGSFIVIDNRPCKVVEVNFKTPTLRRTIFDFVACDIFNGVMHECSAEGNESCEVPLIRHMFYKIEDIEDDGRLVLRNVNGAKKVGPDLILPHDDKPSLAQTRVEFYRGQKNLHVDVKSAMGEEHVTCLWELTKQSPRKRMVFRIR